MFAKNPLIKSSQFFSKPDWLKKTMELFEVYNIDNVVTWSCSTGKGPCCISSSSSFCASFWFLCCCSITPSASEIPIEPWRERSRMLENGGKWKMMILERLWAGRQNYDIGEWPKNGLEEKFLKTLMDLDMDWPRPNEFSFIGVLLQLHRTNCIKNRGVNTAVPMLMWPAMLTGGIVPVPVPVTIRA